VLLSGLAAYLYDQVQDQPWWVTLPFLFTIFGGGVGALLELGLLVTGTPFLLLRSRFTRFVTHIRLLNIAPVLTTIFFFVCSFCIEDASLRTAILYASGFTAFALAPALYYGGANATVPLVILATQVLQIVVVVASGLLHSAYQLVGVFLIVQSITQAIAYLVTTQTPLKSTGFHVLSTLSGYLLFLAAMEALKVNPGLLQERITPITGNPLLLGGFVAVCLPGYAFTMKVSRMTYNIWRTKALRWVGLFQSEQRTAKTGTHLGRRSPYRDRNICQYHGCHVSAGRKYGPGIHVLPGHQWEAPGHHPYDLQPPRGRISQCFRCAGAV